MSLVLSESFETRTDSSFSNAAPFRLKWPRSTFPSTSTGITTTSNARTGKSWVGSATSTDYIMRLISEESTQWDDVMIFGFGIKGYPRWVTSFFNMQMRLVGFDSGGNIVTHVQMFTAGSEDDGDIYFYDSAGTTIIAQALDCRPANATEWYYLEVKVKCHATAGYIIARINGTQVLNQQNIDTSGGGLGTFAGIEIENRETQSVMLDDIYVCNEQGTENNDFLGPVNIYALETDSVDVGGFEWEHIDGGLSTNNSMAVDDAIFTSDVEDGDLVRANTSGLKDMYGMDATVPSGLGLDAVILGAVVTPWARKADTGSRKITGIVKMNGVEYEGTPTEQWYATSDHWGQPCPIDAPDGGWSGADVSAMEAGMTT